jgi:hypothetical protein
LPDYNDKGKNAYFFKRDFLFSEGTFLNSAGIRNSFNNENSTRKIYRSWYGQAVGFALENINFPFCNWDNAVCKYVTKGVFPLCRLNVKKSLFITITTTMEKNTTQKMRHLSQISLTTIFLSTVLLMLTSNVQAQTQITTREGLLNAINSNVSPQSGVITIGNISMENDKDGIIIGSGAAKANLTIQGVTPSNFSTQIGVSGNSILLKGVNITAADITSSFPTGFNTSSLSYITGGNGTHAPSSSSDTAIYHNGYKWFTTHANNSSGSNGLSFQNILFEKVTVAYPSGTDLKYVNGLIGNRYSAGSTDHAAQLISNDQGVAQYGTSLGKVTGNEFSNIKITVNSSQDTNYLAGGGIIGVRNTGEQASGSKNNAVTNLKVPLSAEMDVVSGNYFHGINVTTTDSVSSTSVDYSKKSAYIEGGGIIGVNGVSSPDTSIGHALLKGLENNAFTSITIRSDDVLLGGGIVGVNNNSKDTSGSLPGDFLTYAKMENVTGNIFGNGKNNDIKVDVGYSIRGGGVIGLNGLGSAQIELPTLDKNVFAGIDVTAGTYIKGGGIIGLQNNDDDYDKGDAATNPTPSIDFVAANVHAKDITNNVFVNLNVSVGEYTGNNTSQYLQGGGIIGIRSNKGIASLDNLSNNIFKDITVEVKNADTSGEGLSGGGVVGVNAVDGFTSIKNAEKNYFDGINVSVAGTISGGGVIGAANSNTSTGTSDADISSIKDNTFLNTKVTTTNNGDILGGGILGVSGASGVNALENVTGNQFTGTTGNEITVAGKIDGGGVVGARVSGNSASFLNNVSGNTIQSYDVAVQGTVSGGGLIGVSADSFTVGIGNVANNKLINNTVTSQTDISGGGLIGVRVGTGGASIKTLTDNIFTSNKVETKTTGKIDGGGIIGVNSGAIGIDNIDTMSGNIFSDTTVTSVSTIEGGGIIGVRASTGFAVISNIKNNEFTSSNVSSTGNLEGGGIIGVRADNNSDPSASAGIVAIENNTFSKSTVKTTGSGKIEGGGIIGVRANAGTAEVDNLSNNSFAGSTIESADDLEGGGIIGVRSDGGDATIGNIDGSNQFANTTITVTNTLEGGGFIGVRSVDGDASIGNISSVDAEGSLFKKTVTAKTLEGGGIIGVRSDKGNATIESISNSVFSWHEVETTSGHIQGGGIIGIRSDSLAKINRIENTYFTLNKVTSAKWIDGGGIIGASGSAKGSVDPHGGIRLIDSVGFMGNTITAEDGQIMGGLVYSYGAAEGMKIKDSWFSANDFHSTSTINGYDAKVYGTITIDTGATAYTGDKEHVVTVISSSQNDPTVFYENGIHEGNNSTVRYNSFYFGTMPYIDNNTVQQDYAAANAKLVIASEANGLVLLLDPITASQDNDTGGSFTFNMEVGREDKKASGLLIWAGDNKLELLKTGNVVTDNFGAITMLAGSTTTIVDKNSDTTLINYGTKWSDDAFKEVSTMQLNAPNYTVNLNKGAWLNVEGHNYWDLSTANTNNPKVNFNGDLHFNLNNTEYYNDSTTPDSYTTDPNGTKIPLLTIKTPNQENVIDLSGATVHLQDFLGNTPLKSGDRFYLVDAIDSDSVNQKKFINENKLANNKDADGYFVAYARQGLTRGYYFIIDLNGEHRTGDLVNSHYLTARIRSVAPMPAKELVPPAEGRITGVSFLNHLALPQLYDIDPKCDPCAACDDGSQWVKTPFVSISGDWYSADTGNSSSFDVRGSVFQAGLAFQKKVHHGRIFVGGFFDSGYADYNTYNYIPDIKHNPDFRGDGELTATGGGVLFQRHWKNGWQFNGSVRGGNLRNKFYSDDIKIHNTDFEMRYDTDSSYFGTELGLNRQLKITKRRTLDLYSRYAWLYMEGNTITWNYKDTNNTSYSETVRFNGINSHRLTAGSRYTRQHSTNISSYLGAAFEYEFDGQANGSVKNVGRFNGQSLRGGYGIGEIGLIQRRNDNFQFIAGLQGYAGNRTGGNVNLSAVWKW